MNAENLLKKSILRDKGWQIAGDHYVHPEQATHIWAADVPKFTVSELRARLG